MTNRADIDIRLRGSSAATMERRAAALERLAMATQRLSLAAKRLPRVTTQATQFAGGITKAQKRTDRFGTSLTNTGNALDNFGTLFARMIRIMTAFAIITAVVTVFRELVAVLAEAPAKMELWNTQLTTLTGSATIAAEKLELLKTVAIETPLELPDLFQGLTTLRAFNVEMSERTLPLLTDLAAVSGRTFQEIAEVAGKVIQGSPTAITRSLPTVGINPDVFKALAAEVGSRAEALFQIIEDRFKGFAKRSAQTTIGILSNIKDAIFVIAADVGQGILDAFRPQIQAVFDALDELRKSPEQLEQITDQFRSLSISLIEMLKTLGKIIPALLRVVDILGGMRGILISIGVVLSSKALRGVVAMVRTTNAAAAAVTVAALGVGKFVSEMSKADAQARRTAQAQSAFADQLARTIRLAKEDLSLVDARLASQQGNRLNALAARGGSLVSGGAGVGRIQGFLEEVQRTTTGVASGSQATRLRTAMEDFQMLLVGPTPPAEALAAIVSQDVIPVLNDLSEQFFRTARNARGLGETVVDVGEVSGNLGEQLVGGGPFSQLIQRAQAIRKIREEIAKAQVSGIKQRVSSLTAQFDMGLINETDFLGSLSRIRAQLKTRIAELFASGDPIKENVAIELTGVVTGIEGIEEEINKNVRDPISQSLETALRQAIQRGADAVADALSNLGDGFAKQLGLAFAGLLSAFGDMLIQLGIGKLALDDLMEKLAALIPGGGVAAIAAGIALKALAGGIAGRLRSSAQSSIPDRPSPPSRDPITFTPVGASPNQSVNVTIQAIDAQSVEQFVNANPDSFAGAVINVARQDRATDGSAFGVFAPVRA